MSNPLRAEKAVKAGREFEQFVKSVAKWNNDRHTMISPWCVIAHKHRCLGPPFTTIIQRVGWQYKVECADCEYGSYCYQCPSYSFLQSAWSCHTSKQSTVPPIRSHRTSTRESFFITDTIWRTSWKLEPKDDPIKLNLRQSFAIKVHRTQQLALPLKRWIANKLLLLKESTERLVTGSVKKSPTISDTIFVMRNIAQNLVSTVIGRKRIIIRRRWRRQSLTSIFVSIMFQARYSVSNVLCRYHLKTTISK